MKSTLSYGKIIKFPKSEDPHRNHSNNKEVKNAIPKYVLTMILPIY